MSGLIPDGPETAGQVVEDALNELIVQACEQDVQSCDMQIGLRYLNRMMEEFAALGMSTGYTLVTSPTDCITVPGGMIAGIVANLAVALAPQFDRNVSPSLAQRAAMGIKAIENLTVEAQPSDFSGNVAIGSGNESSPYDEHFYINDEEEINGEYDGPILLE